MYNRKIFFFCQGMLNVFLFDKCGLATKHVKKMHNQRERLLRGWGGARQTTFITNIVIEMFTCYLQQSAERKWILSPKSVQNVVLKRNNYFYNLFGLPLYFKMYSVLFLRIIISMWLSTFIVYVNKTNHTNKMHWTCSPSQD